MHTRSKSSSKDTENTNSSASHSTSVSTKKQPRPKGSKQTGQSDCPMEPQGDYHLENDPVLIQQANQQDQPRRAAAHRHEDRSYAMANNEEKPVGEYITPTIGNYDSPIYIPDGEGYDFNIKGGLIHMVKGDQFDGYGNPHHHLSNFTEMCRTFKNTGVPQEVVYMKLFPFSLSDKAKDWLTNHEPKTFRTWESLAQAFVKQYFPPAKVKKIRDRISKFVQFDNESFYKAYERFRGLLRDCPHHEFSKWELLSAFYDGMDENARANGSSQWRGNNEINPYPRIRYHRENCKE